MGGVRPCGRVIEEGDPTGFVAQISGADRHDEDGIDVDENRRPADRQLRDQRPIGRELKRHRRTLVAGVIYRPTARQPHPVARYGDAGTFAIAGKVDIHGQRSSRRDQRCDDECDAHARQFPPRARKKKGDIHDGCPLSAIRRNHQVRMLIDQRW
jgi:hypothetical protein